MVSSYLVVNARDAMANGGILRIAAENVVIGEHSTQINIDAKVGSYIAIVVTDIVRRDRVTS